MSRSQNNKPAGHTEVLPRKGDAEIGSNLVGWRRGERNDIRGCHERDEDHHFPLRGAEDEPEPEPGCQHIDPVDVMRAREAALRGIDYLASASPKVILSPSNSVATVEETAPPCVKLVTWVLRLVERSDSVEGMAPERPRTSHNVISATASCGIRDSRKGAT